MPRTSPIKVPIVGEDKLAKQMEATEKRVKKFQKQMGAMGKSLTRNVTLPLGIADVALMKFARDINASMANVSTLLTGGIGQVQGLKKGVQDMAIETGKSTEDLSAGLYDVVSALGESEDNINQLSVAARASVAGLSTTQEAIGLLSATTKGYGDTSSEAQKKVSDLAFMTVKLGVTTFPDLAASMGRVIPLAATLNTSQEELFGTMATLTGVTGNAAEVSTQIASIYSAMLKPTALLTKTAKKLGYESASQMMKQEGLRNTLLKLNEAFKGNEDKMAKALKRKEGLVAVLALLGGQSDTYKTKLDAMNDAIGATDAAYKKQTEGINKQGHEWEKTKQRLMVFAQRLGDRLLPIMERLFDRLEPWLKKLEGMSDETLDWTIKIGGLAMALGPAIGGLSKMIGVVSTLRGGMLGAGSAISGLSGNLANLPAQAGAASKALMALKGAGAVAAAGAAGYAAGTALSKAVIEPHAEKKAEDKQRRRELLKEVQWSKGKGSHEKRMKLLEEIKMHQKKMGELSMPSSEELAGGFVKIFGGPAVPKQVSKADLAKARKMLESSIEADLGIAFESRMPGPTKDKTTTYKEEVTISFKDVPPGVKIDRRGTKAPAADTGVVMESP